MSPWFEVAGWTTIAAGAWTTLRDGRPLLLRITSHGRDKTSEPEARRKAWRNVFLSLLVVVAGVSWLASWYEHEIWKWLFTAVVAVVVSWDLGSWLRSRRRHNSGGRAAELS
jgi:hypothetical protein